MCSNPVEPPVILREEKNMEAFEPNVCSVFQQSAIQWMSRAVTRVEKTAYCTGLILSSSHSSSWINQCIASMAPKHVQYTVLYIVMRARGGWRGGGGSRGTRWLWTSHIYGPFEAPLHYILSCIWAHMLWHGVTETCSVRNACRHMLMTCCCHGNERLDRSFVQTAYQDAL